MMQAALRPLDVAVIPTHEQESPARGLEQADAIFVGGILVGGPTGGRLFLRGKEPRELAAGNDLTSLSRKKPRYDSPL
jgi:hypothetical protein